MNVERPANAGRVRLGRGSRGRTLLDKGWLPLITVIALGVGSVCIWKVHQTSEPGPVPAVLVAQAPEQFTLKRLTYELFGSIGDGGMLSYVDINGQPHRVDLTELPW